MPTRSDELLRLLSQASIGDLIKAQSYIKLELTPAHLQTWNKTASPLLRLPRELRDHILADVLVDRHNIEIPCRDDDISKQGDVFFTTAALLHASHQLRQEAAEIYYAKNAFSAASDALYEWLPSLSLEHRGLIEKIQCTASCRVHWWHHERAKAAEIAGKMEADLGIRKGRVWAEVEQKDSGAQVWVNSCGTGLEHEV